MPSRKTPKKTPKTTRKPASKASAKPSPRAECRIIETLTPETVAVFVDGTRARDGEMANPRDTGYRLDVRAANESALKGVRAHVKSPELHEEISRAVGDDPALHAAIGLWGLKVRLRNPELDRAWGKMMVGLAPRRDEVYTDPDQLTLFN